VSVDEHGSIPRVSAPQWSTGRPIKRSPAAPPQTRGARPLPSTLGPAPDEPAQTVLDRVVADLAVPDLALHDLTDPDLVSPDLADAGLLSPELANRRSAVPDVAVSNPADPGLADPGLAVPDLAVHDLTDPDLVSPDPADADLLSPALANRRLAVAVSNPADPGLADPGLAGPGLADPGLADPGLAVLGFADSDHADHGLGLTGGPHPVELAGLLHELSALLLSADDLSQALHRLAAFTARAVPGARRCSVVLIGERAPLTVAASGAHAQAFDDLQYTTGQGPGLDAARTRTLVTAHDVARDPRWPELSDCARAEGLHAVAAIPLDVQRSWVGALSLYARRGEGIGPDLLLTAMALVGQAEVLLGELRRRAALGEGATVDRAAGVIIAQRGCGVHEAYDVLEDTANRLGLDRHTVADRLVAAAASRRPDS
jgi:ANTAR domain/GAF domain